MTRLSAPLDATRTGREAAAFAGALRALIAGQDEAVARIVDCYQMFLTGMQPPGRPVGSFLFLGPTGSGKTRIVEATAEILAGTARAAIKVDCGEFQHSHEIAKLIGSPPGYVGHRETRPMLSQEALNEFHTERLKLSFVLFDEIEKASDALWNLLLGILDKGTLTLGDGRRVDFSKAMVFMTSNLGAAAMESLMRPRLGFIMAAGDAARASKIETAGIEAARRKFSPEFINRLDKIVVFRPLGEAELRQVLEIELGMVQARTFRSTGAGPFTFNLTQAAKDYLLREGTDEKYGARYLKRAVERILVQPMANLVASGQVREGDVLCVDCSPDGPMVFTVEAERVPVYVLAEKAKLAPPRAAAA
jgi:ATP-dependent Clp protease ATP-binding subunit ClpB